MAFRKKRKDPFTEIQACLQKRDWKGALDWFNTLLQKDPKNTQIRLRFADTLVLAGSKREAIKQYHVVADELSEKGFMIRAIAINKKILQLDPNQKDVHQKLVEMSGERTAPEGKTTSLADVLTQPGAPFRRYSEPAAEPPPPAPEPEPEPPPASLPALSLEESMAMEFGGPGDVPKSAPIEEPIPAPPPAEPATGGFELLGDPATSPESPVEEPEAVLLPDEPSFAEEPFDLGEGEEAKKDEIITLDAESDSEIDLTLEGIEAPIADSPEIVLDLESSTEAAATLDDDAPVIDADDVGEIDEDDEAALYQTGDMEVVAFDLQSEPDSAEPLLAALGEDIDSLIDSIIDDVGSSAKREQPEEEKAPTHIPLFSDLTSSEFIAVALLLFRRVAKVGETIVKEGNPGDSMFIVSTGEVRATIERDGQQIPVATLKDGDFFGEMAVLSGEPRTATVTAVKATELLELNRDNLREICSRHPHVEAKIRLAYDERVARSQGH